LFNYQKKIILIQHSNHNANLFSQSQNQRFISLGYAKILLKMYISCPSVIYRRIFKYHNMYIYRICNNWSYNISYGVCPVELIRTACIHRDVTMDRHINKPQLSVRGVYQL